MHWLHAVLCKASVEMTMFRGNKTCSFNYYCLLCFRYCQSRREALLDHVYEGYDMDFWEFIE